ncbi:EF-hand calcium-binding domain-containing protein 12 [Rhea pennata]|uniref:EF-hand calcium-binding domain-containing protein 12 n=1 Tax=Rhea pennata TaxID=8795 RepID=UPI002E25FEA6
MMSKDLIDDLTDVRPELFLGHCFKRHRLRNMYPQFFLKLKASRFGPPKSRRRIIFAPPMAGPAFPFSQPTPGPNFCHSAVLQTPQEGEDSLSSPRITSDTEDDLQKLEAWIIERKQFRSQLESLVDVERWLMRKASRSDQEERVWRRIKACRADRKARSKSGPTHSPECSPAGSGQLWCRGSAPVIRVPYPRALVMLHNLLHKHSLKMVDLFRKADMDRGEITREDFIKVIKETKVPISDKDLEEVIIFLTSSKRGNFISNDDLIECQDQWLEMMQGQCRETKTGVQAEGKTKEMKPPVPTKPETALILLEVPPINMEPERRHLTYDEMEEIGKQFRDRRRREKSKDTPIEWKEKCRLVRSGDKYVDEHCLPSTLEGDMAELVDQYRRNCFLTYLKSFKLCKDYKIHLTKMMLQKALLHPGDKIIKEGEDILKIRQPGGPYTTTPTHTLSPVSASRKQAKEMQNRQLQRNKMQKKIAHVSESNDNNFWPGHLLDKICLYLPSAEPGRAHALFSYVHSTKPVYHGIYNPERSWLVSDQGYLTYGDTAFRKTHFL